MACSRLCPSQQKVKELQSKLKLAEKLLRYAYTCMPQSEDEKAKEILEFLTPPEGKGRC